MRRSIGMVAGWILGGAALLGVGTGCDEYETGYVYDSGWGYYDSGYSYDYGYDYGYDDSESLIHDLVSTELGNYIVYP